MGSNITFFQPAVKNPKTFYNFQWKDKRDDGFQAIRISGKTPLHNALLEVTDLRAGATVLLAAICAQGESTIKGVGHIDRGYERIEERLTNLGASIKRVQIP